VSDPYGKMEKSGNWWDKLGKSGMGSLIGEFKITLDDKGRVSLPSRLRAGFSDNTLILTKGADEGLWLYPEDEWNILLSKVKNSSNALQSHSRAFMRHFIGPAQEVEIDKAGRIAVPQSLREFAYLTRDCIILGQIDHVEIWDAQRYRAYLDGSEEEYKIASDELGASLQRDRGYSNRDGT
jgi:MraZ protein